MNNRYAASNPNVTLFLVVVFVLLSSPFSFSSVFVGNSMVTAVLQAGVLFLLLLHVKKFQNVHVCIISFLFIYMIVQLLIRPSLMMNYFFPLLYCAFGVVLHAIIKTNGLFRNSLINFWKKLSIIVSLSVIISAILVRIAPFLFVSKDLQDYPVLFNYLLGSVSVDEANPLRPSWYFFEPSYAGCFIGLSFFASQYLFLFNKKNKYRYYVLFIVAILAIGSFGTLAYVSICILASMILTRIKSKTIRYVLIVLVILVPVFYLMINAETFIENTFVSQHTASTGTRIRRIQDGLEVISSMGFKDLLLGYGLDYHGSVYDEGQSIAYLRMIEEEGLVFLFVYMIVLINQLKNNSVLLLFILLEMLSVVIYCTPLIFLSIILIGSLSYVKYNTNATYFNYHPSIQC